MRTRPFISREAPVQNRREFLRVTLVSSALPILAGAQREASSYSGVTRVRVDRVVAEMTSPLALAFHAEAVGLGLAAHGIHDDITDLWYHKLDRQWRTAPATLAGITLLSSFFCLEMLARDYGMCVRFRALHKNRPDGRGEPFVGVSDWSGKPRPRTGHGAVHSQDSLRPRRSPSRTSSNRRLWGQRRLYPENRVPWSPGLSRRG